MNLKLALGLILCGPVTADMYLQFPGGSNNRLNEPNRATRNANRLFDSQNNNRFGHNQHGHYFYTNSEIDMQWTVQHSCGPDSNLNCDVILQYACEDNLRDGQVLSTIPSKSEDCANEDCNSDYNYGMHEDYQSYQHCTLRERNKGLYQADRRLRGEDARFTRQENNGQRYGYECNEERDHYPYWHPTIWKDIVVYTDDTSRCSYYQMESENVKGRWYCKVSDEFLNNNYDPNDRDYLIPINKEDCEDLEGAQWVLSEPHTYPNGKSMPPPMCMEAPYQRDNHHGNGDSRHFVGHKWTVPEDLVHPSCSIRIRYNITSSDYNAWNIGNDATEYNRRIADIPTTHDGKCYDMAKGPALYGNEYNEIDVDNAVVITRQADIGLKFTRQSLQDDFWRLETGSRGWQWFGWEIPEFKNKKVKVSFDVRFREKPTASNCGVKFYGVMEQSWIATAPIGEWKTVEITRDLPNSGDSYRVLIGLDSAPVDLDLRGFQICNLDDDVCYDFGEGPATLSGLSFEESKVDVKNDLAIVGPRDLSIKMTRDATDRDVWKLQTFKTNSGWQWFGWESSHLAYKTVKVSFDVKFKTKPTNGNQYGMRFFGKWRREWIEEAPIGEWYHVDFVETLPRAGDKSRILMVFNYNVVELELKNLNLCVEEDDLFYEVNPFASMQDELDFSAYTARQRGYEHRNDARLQIFESIPMRLRSAYNTDQLGRVFEDRSHQIEFVELPQEIKQNMRENNKKLYNLNARGKIGNNVEVYPAFEYDFVPSRLVANEGDYLHIQFSGSNTNDHGNDHSQVDSNGQTVRILRGKDRHNMVAIDRMDAIRPTAEREQLSSLLGLTARESMSLAFSGVKGGDNEYLQSAGAYFDLGPKKLTKKGKHMFMSTINSAHGVRIQKGKIIVNEPDDGFSIMVNGPDDGPSMMENEPDDGPSMMGFLN